MANDIIDGEDSWFLQLRRLIVPNWIWQFAWLRHLPRYYRSVDWTECKRSGWQVVLDMLYIFFRLRTVPEHYAPNRLWERPRSEWPLYYGCPYTPVAWGRIARRVYPFRYRVLYNDKLVCAMLCKGLNIRQPVIYGRLEPGAGFHNDAARILESSGQQQLMLKPVFGRSGIGIVRIERTADGSRALLRQSDAARGLSHRRTRLFAGSDPPTSRHRRDLAQLGQHHARGHHVDRRR